MIDIWSWQSTALISIRRSIQIQKICFNAVMEKSTVRLIYDILDKLYIDISIQPKQKMDERRAALEMLKRMNGDDQEFLVLMDANTLFALRQAMAASRSQQVQKIMNMTSTYLVELRIRIIISRLIKIQRIFILSILSIVLPFPKTLKIIVGTSKSFALSSSELASLGSIRRDLRMNGKCS